MPHQEARAQELLRERRKRKQTMQIWVVLFAAWVLVVGWVVAGFVNDVESFLDSPSAILTYALPAVGLGIGALIAWSRWRATGAALLALEESKRA